MSTITKKELTDRIAESTQTKRMLVKATVQKFLDFGVFEPRECAPRTAQNPKTLERICVPAKRTVRFKMGRLMKQKLNGRNVET